MRTFVFIIFLTALITGCMDPGNPLATAWLPDERIARMWKEFVETGWITDDTPPEAPFNLTAEKISTNRIKITWEVQADLDSGIKQFHLYRNGKMVKWYVGINDLYVEKNFQYGNYGDEPGPEALYENVKHWKPNRMEFNDYRLNPDSSYRYQVTMINWSGLESMLSNPIDGKLNEL